MTEERWMRVVGYETHYEVSDRGRVRRIAPARGTRIGRELRASPDTTTGYPKVGLSVAGISVDAHVHRLVAAAFIGPCPAGITVNHIDGDKANNHLANLEYATYAENNKHARDTGLNVVSGVIETKCPQCGKSVYGYPSQKRRFCSRACRARFTKPRLGTGRNGSRRNVEIAGEASS